MKKEHIGWLYMIGAGIAGFLGTRYVINAMNKDEKSEFLGRRKKKKKCTCPPTPTKASGTMQTYKCVNYQTGASSTLTTNNYDEFASFQNECQQGGGSMTPRYFNDGSRPQKRTSRFSNACGCA